MEKNKKSDLIAKIKQRFQESEAVFVVNQNRLTVAETEDLRKQLRAVQSVYLVAKNTLARLAVKDTDFECVSEKLGGQTALVFSKDITGSAKVVSEYASKSDEKLSVVCGGYQGKMLSVAEIKTLASLPSMDELRAKIVAVIQTPAQRMATLSQAPASQLARVLKAYSEK
ncbi:MAG: 50S ribosomal protein L10 [Alphaproteobacteria bacterium]|nr:50S ribosomal protein L10 [Alphaproteobacteria bacterium]MBO7537533.1 50S ribosomal protein L10 [Alphaproteobacteria bacterium]MBO7642203.1 50S ribosomal protein L10 [Alphaproteobacteria bacterium]